MSELLDETEPLAPTRELFWREVKEGDIHLAQNVLRTCQAPEVEKFGSVEDEEEEGTLESIKLSVETTNAYLRLWNHGEEVGLVRVNNSRSCRFLATPKGMPKDCKDNKFCHEINCAALTHKGPGNRFRLPTEGNYLAITVRDSSQSRGFAFIRPLIAVCDLPEDFVNDDGVERLLAMKAKPKVWKWMFDGYEKEDPEEEDPEEEDSEEGGGENFERSLEDFGTQRLLANRRRFSFESDDEDDKVETGSQDNSQESGAGNQMSIEERFLALTMRLDDQELELKELRSVFEDRDVGLTQTFRKLRTKIKGMEAKMDATPKFGGVGSKYLTKNQIQELTHSILEAEGVVRLSDLPRDLKALCEQLRRAVLLPEGPFNKLIQHMDVVESRTTDAIEIAGKVFRDAEDVAVWLHTLPRDVFDNILGLVMDLKTIFILAEESYDTVETGLSAEAASSKAGYQSYLAGVVSVSYHFPYPEGMLRKSNKLVEARDEGVEWSTQWALHEIFIGNHLSSTMARVKKNLASVKRMTLNTINMSLPASDAQQTLNHAILTEMVNVSYDQATALVLSLDPLYTTIHQGGMSEKEAWRRVKLYLKGVFDRIQTVRSVTFEKRIEAQVWGSMLTMQMCSVYHDHGWIKHPEVSSILALSALEHEGEAFEKLAKVVKEMESTISSLNSDRTRMKAQIKTLQEKVN